MNPIESVEQWVEGVGHQYHTELYTSLVLEEAKEMLESLSFLMHHLILLGYLFVWLIRLLGLALVVPGQNFIDLTFRISRWMDDFRRHHQGRF